MNFDQLCNNFLKSNEKIRFVGVINPSGNLILQKNRKDTTSLLSDDETNMLIHYSFSRWKRLENIEYKLGKITETVTKFEKVSTIMLFYNGNLFLISTDPKSNNSKIISDLWKIIDGKPIARKSTRASAAKKKTAARKSTRASAAKKKTAARKSTRASAAKKKTAARKSTRASAAKKKTAARKSTRASAAKKKTAARKSTRASAAKKKTAARKSTRASAAKKKTAARKSTRASAAKKKTAARKSTRASAAKKKTAARKSTRASAAKKKTATSISKNQVSPELMSKLDQLEEYANSLYQKIRK